MPARQAKDAYEYYGNRNIYINAEETADDERDDLRLVTRDMPRLNKRVRQKCQIFAVMFILMAVFTAILNSYIACQGYMLGNSRSELRQLSQENDMLKIDIAKMKSPQRIQQIATKELGMSVPNKSYFAGEISR